MHIQIERVKRVVKLRIARTESRNALSDNIFNELMEIMRPLDHDPTVGCFLVCGQPEYFSAGADIREMAMHSQSDMVRSDYFAGWGQFCQLRTPKVAAVSGYAFGGGCELMMMCDISIAAQSARFAQPEIKLGVMPGIGATQRLTHLVGKARAMDILLTGRELTAQEAEKIGLISRVIPDEALETEALRLADTVAGWSKPAAIATREAVNAAEEMGLQAGLTFERRLFHSLFANQDQQEGMRAFLEKRPAHFIHQ
ncbi:enoyl-CoA hydratase-related protein [Pantoea sp.]|uniref:enoyl-CoA hydratase-related protein n=1 Tax=Pantoea sp. TaxID=69393 RepID=UPI0031DB6103